MFIVGVGVNDKLNGKKTLAHLNYQAIHRMWHPTKNQGKLPADFTHASIKRVWLRCPGCNHGCGRHHESEARLHSLTRNGGHVVCHYCESEAGSFCECRSVESDPRLSKEWHSGNPPSREVAKSSHKSFLWVCLEGHLPYMATCNNRSNLNTGCPVCGVNKSRTTRHPVVSVGRPVLAREWDCERNAKSPREVTLGSHYMASWVCSSNPEHPPWQTVVQSRALRGSGCPACVSQNRFKPKFFGPTCG
jgi:hypothetical protein